MKRQFGLSLLLVGLAFFPARAANVPEVPLVKGSLAELQAIGAAASQYPDVQTTSYYSGGGKGGAFYHWSSSSAVTDCAHIAVSGVTTGRYVLRTDLQNNSVLPTQCGAYFDSSADGSTGHDDSAAWQAAYDAAFAYGFIVGPVPGITRLVSTINPHYGTILQGAGQGVETIQCWANISGNPCLYLQAPVSGATFQGPQFRDFSIAGNLNSNLIQINCLTSGTYTCGFTDDGTTQGYITGVIIERVSANVPTYAESSIAFQLNKCFHCVIRYSDVGTTNLHGIDIEGSDFTTVEHNRVIAFNFAGGNYHAIHVAQQGSSFGNFDLIENNDTLRARNATDAYIYSSARVGKITFNGIEDFFGDGASTCNIKVENGLEETIASNNLAALLNAGDNYGMCVNGNGWYSLDLHDNSVPTGNAWAHNFNGNAGITYYVSGGAGPRVRIQHYNNNNEDGIPFNTSGSGGFPFGTLLYDSTPDSLYGPNNSNLGFTVRVQAAGLLNNNSPAWVLPNSGETLNFTYPPYPLKGTMSLCFKAIAGAASNTIHAQINDNGVSAATATVTLSVTTGTLLQCPAALQHVAIATVATFIFWNDDVVHNGNDYLAEVIVSAG